MITIIWSIIADGSMGSSKQPLHSAFFIVSKSFAIAYDVTAIMGTAT